MINKKKILNIILIMFLSLIFLNLKTYAKNPVINLKVGETVKKELLPNLASYEVLSLNKNGSGKDSVEQKYSNENYDISFKLEGSFGDKLTFEIKAKKPGKLNQEIKYYMYRKSGEPFTPFRSEISINIEDVNNEQNTNNNKNVNNSNEKNNEVKNNKSEKNNKKENNKIILPSSRVQKEVNKKTIKVYPQNSKYLTLGKVYLREGNSVGTNSIELIPEGTLVNSNGYTDNGWVRVMYNGREGFLSTNYIALKKSSKLTEEMKKKAEIEKKEYEKELKKVGFVNSTGQTKDEQIEDLKNKIGNIPNVGANLQLKIFMLFNVLSIGILLIYLKKIK